MQYQIFSVPVWSNVSSHFSSSVSSVSYTHLDVYKRQAKKRAEKSAEGKETGDYTLSVTGNDVKSMTQSLVAGSVSISVPDRSSFDIKA